MTSATLAPTEGPNRMRWVILAAAVFARTSIGLQFISVAALMPLVRAELSLSYTQVGLLLGLFMLAGVFISVPSGIFAARFGERRVLFGGLAALIAAGIITAAADGLPMMLTGRILGGTGAVLITVTAAKILTDWFHGQEISTAMGFLGLSWPLGIAIGLSLLPELANWSGWRAAILATNLLPLGAVLAALLIPRLGQPLAGTTRSSAHKRPLWVITRREAIAILIGGMAWPLMSSGGYVVFSSYAPELLTAKGLSISAAGLAVGLMSWLFMFTIPLGGWLTDRFGRGDALFRFGCLFSAGAIALVPMGGPAMLWMVLAAVMGVTVGPIMTLPGQVLGPASRATGLGIYFSVYYLGTVVLPASAGWLLDASRSSAVVVWYAATCLTLAPLSLYCCRALQRRWNLGG